jgi:hypothetical protein
VRRRLCPRRRHRPLTEHNDEVPSRPRSEAAEGERRAVATRADFDSSCSPVRAGHADGHVQVLGRRGHCAHRASERPAFQLHRGCSLTPAGAGRKYGTSMPQDYERGRPTPVEAVLIAPPDPTRPAPDAPSAPCREPGRDRGGSRKRAAPRSGAVRLGHAAVKHPGLAGQIVGGQHGVVAGRRPRRGEPKPISRVAGGNTRARSPRSLQPRCRDRSSTPWRRIASRRRRT